MAFRTDPRTRSATGRRSRPARRRSWWARARAVSALRQSRLIVVDEEHDRPTSRTRAAHYHARDMAVVRAHIAKIPIVLASATPLGPRPRSMRARAATSAWCCRRGSAPAHAAYRGDRPAPPRRRRAPLHFAASGRRDQDRDRAPRAGAAVPQPPGYAPLTLCRACGHRFACTICDAWLVDHRFRQRLVCHHCGFSMPAPACLSALPDRGIAGRGRPRVERLQEEAAQLFRRPHHGAVERPDHLDRSHAQRVERDRGRPRRHHHRQRN